RVAGRRRWQGAHPVAIRALLHRGEEMNLSRACIGLALGVLCVCLLRADPPVYPDRSKLLVWRDEQSKEHPVRTPADWEKRRAHILAGMQQAMGPLPDASRKVPLDVEVTAVLIAKTYARKKLTFAVEKGDRVPAYLFLPQERK